MLNAILNVIAISAMVCAAVETLVRTVIHNSA